MKVKNINLAKPNLNAYNILTVKTKVVNIVTDFGHMKIVYIEKVVLVIFEHVKHTNSNFID